MLKGNQFVWIPCTEEEYVQTNWGNYIGCWCMATNTAEVSQIKKYGGFYVGRYEAGLAKTITEYTSTQLHEASNYIYNVTGIPQSKANLIPWTFITWDMAQKNSKLLYNTDSVHSGLITGTQWDVILNKLIEKNDLAFSDVATNSEIWGNYTNNSIAYNGRLAQSYISAGRWHAPAFGKVQVGNTRIFSGANGEVFSTGASKTTEKYHIFDIAGNEWEFVEEISFLGGNALDQFRNQRGGSYVHFSNGFPASFRYGGERNNAGMDTGFRMVLYIQ